LRGISIMYCIIKSNFSCFIIRNIHYIWKNYNGFHRLTSAVIVTDNINRI
jgi:hypothetical protein